MLSFVYEHMTTWIRDEGYADNRFSPPDAISFRYVQKIAWDPTRWFNGRLWDTLPDTISFRYATEDSMDIWHMTALRSVGSLFLTRFLFRDILGEEYMDWQMISLTDKTDSLFPTVWNESLALLLLLLISTTSDLGGFLKFFFTPESKKSKTQNAKSKGERQRQRQKHEYEWMTASKMLNVACM